jgi:prepilin-type processing-associated H-X9-DG protein
MTRRGLTLVEITVALGVTSLMVALSVGGLRAAGDRARSERCRGNLRQISLAAQAYACSHGGHLPPAILYFQRSGGLRTLAWDFEQQAGQVRPGSIWKFTDQPQEVQQCPACASASTFGADPFTGYHYNTTYLGAEGLLPAAGEDGERLDGWDRVRAGVGPGQWRRTESVAVFADGGWRGGANKFMRAPSGRVEGDLGLVYAGAGAFRHGGRCNVAWLDGHVEGAEQPHEGEHATPTLLRSVMDWPSNGFLSPDDSAYDPR